MVRRFGLIQQAALKDSWLTIGTYDGVHIGHQEIIRHLVIGARAAGVPSVVVTFNPHPTAVTQPEDGSYLLTLPDERAEYLGEVGVDVVIIHPFDQAVASTTAEDFLALCKKHLGFHHLDVGYDFALGYKRAGDIYRLTELERVFDYQLQVIPPVLLNGQIVSSSRIRGLLHEGRVAEAALELGRRYKITGEVVRGDGRGRTLGIPTANIFTSSEKLLPLAGVYACLARSERLICPAAVNIGVRPTFDGSATGTHVEAHLLDYQGNLYGEHLSLHFIARLRGEKRFTNLQELIRQIHQDIEKTRDLVKIPNLAI